MGISVFLPVFNEEKRIEQTLTSLMWCDEIILLDKNSTDNTVEIAKKFKAKVYFMQNTDIYDPSEFDYMIKYCKNEWILLFTASDIMNLSLSVEIEKLIGDPGFDYDIISVPICTYVLGIYSKRSPWFTEYHDRIFKKAIVKVDKSEVHSALVFDSLRKYTINNMDNSFIYHLTHKTVDGMIDRHIRYWRAEGEQYSEANLWKAFNTLIRSLFHVIVKRKTFLLGWDGLALGCAFLSYYMMSFLYKWEKKYSKADIIYDNIRTLISNEWDSKSQR